MCDVKMAAAGNGTRPVPVSVDYVKYYKILSHLEDNFVREKVNNIAYLQRYNNFFGIHDDDADNNIPHVLTIPTKSVDVLRYNVLALKIFAPDTVCIIEIQRIWTHTMKYFNAIANCVFAKPLWNISCKPNSQSAYLDMKKCAVYFIVK